MKWPRGRYNGRRVVGVAVNITVDVTFWRLRWLCGGCSLGPIRVWVGWEYE